MEYGDDSAGWVRKEEDECQKMYHRQHVGEVFDSMFNSTYTNLVTSTPPEPTLFKSVFQ